MSKTEFLVAVCLTIMTVFVIKGYKDMNNEQENRREEVAKQVLYKMQQSKIKTFTSDEERPVE
jgi:hypothetical protein